MGEDGVEPLVEGPAALAVEVINLYARHAPGVHDHEVGVPALLDPTLVQAEELGRPLGHRPDQDLQGEQTLLHQREHQGHLCLHPGHPGGRGGELLLLVLDGVGRVIGTQHLDPAGNEGLQQREAVLRGPQRGIDLGVRPPLGIAVQEQMVGRYFLVKLQLLSGPQPLSGGDVADVDAAAQGGQLADGRHLGPGRAVLHVVAEIVLDLCADEALVLGMHAEHLARALDRQPDAAHVRLISHQ